MHKLKKHLLIGFVAILFTTIGCDKVEDPITPITGNDQETYGPPPSFNPATSDMIIQRVVIEDFTGHQCGNCPEAAVVAEEIKSAHPGKVSIIAIHAGDFTDVSEDYPEDWTSNVGDELWNNIPGQFNPGGRVNRAPISNALHLHNAWSDLTNDQLAIAPKTTTQIAYSLYPEDLTINVHIFTEILYFYPGNLKMVAYLTESNLVGNQLDYNAIPTHIEEYDFEFVLRDAINGNSGVSLGNNISPDTSIQKDYTYQYNAAWNIENCHIVAVIYDGDSGVIINSAEIDID